MDVREIPIQYRFAFYANQLGNLIRDLEAGRSPRTSAIVELCGEVKAAMAEAADMHNPKPITVDVAINQINRPTLSERSWPCKAGHPNCSIDSLGTHRWGAPISKAAQA